MILIRLHGQAPTKGTGVTRSSARYIPSLPADNWRTKAACAGHPPEMWEAGGVDKLAALSEAKLICARCPVADECLEAASAGDLEHSMRAGRMPRLQAERSVGRPLGYSPITGTIKPPASPRRGMLARGVCTDGLHALTSPDQVLSNGQCRQCYNRKQREKRADEAAEREYRPHHNSAKTHCAQGHEYTEENTYRRPGAPNKRICRACDRGRKRV